MKSALITGGSRGIGKAITECFAKNGYTAVFLYAKNNEAAKATALESGAAAIRCDVSDPASVREACAEVEKLIGAPDVIVNNAGISNISLFQDVSDSQWSGIINTNLSSAFYVCRYFAPAMIQRHSGRIINIGSVWGKHGASCEVAYSASKAGLRGLTSALAKELGPSGITVNCIEPGVIMTDMCASFDEDTLNELKNATSLGRLGTPEDVANAVLFLASDAASFITGQFLGVDGGFPLG